MHKVSLFNLIYGHNHIANLMDLKFFYFKIYIYNHYLCQKHLYDLLFIFKIFISLLFLIFLILYCLLFSYKNNSIYHVDISIENHHFFCLYLER